jgi:hypothetical protein
VRTFLVVELILTIHLRYSTKNLLIPIILPGPYEQNAEQLQHYIRIIVDDLLQLFNEGIQVCTPRHPNGRSSQLLTSSISDLGITGRLVRVALLAIVSDHPAMCKAAGFADHAHKNWPCTKCNVTRDELYSDLSLADGTYFYSLLCSLTRFIGYAPRNGKDFRRKAQEYRSLDSDDARKRYFDEHGVRWTEFARLTYFDIVRCSVIDPMHNLLQGVVKNQWFSRWIKTSALRPATDRRRRELSKIHDFMDSVSYSLIFEWTI